MWFGYITYPDAYLTTQDRSILEQSEFISPIKLTGKVPSCESIGASALYSTSVSALPGLERVTVGGAVSPSLVCAHGLLVATTRTTIAARPAP